LGSVRCSPELLGCFISRCRWTEEPESSPWGLARSNDGLNTLSWPVALLSGLREPFLWCKSTAARLGGKWRGGGDFPASISIPVGLLLDYPSAHASMAFGWCSLGGKSRVEEEVEGGFADMSGKVLRHALLKSLLSL